MRESLELFNFGFKKDFKISPSAVEADSRQKDEWCDCELYQPGVNVINNLRP